MSSNFAPLTAPWAQDAGFLVFWGGWLRRRNQCFSRPARQADERNTNPSVVMIVSIRATIRATIWPLAVYNWPRGCINVCVLCVCVCVCLCNNGSFSSLLPQANERNKTPCGFLIPSIGRKDFAFFHSQGGASLLKEWI